MTSTFSFESIDTDINLFNRKFKEISEKNEALSTMSRKIKVLIKEYDYNLIYIEQRSLERKKNF